MTRLHILLLTAAMFAGTPALAQEATDFTGPRAEASIGLDQLRFDLASLGAGGRAKQSGLIAGIEGGVNFSDVRYTSGDATDGSELRKRRELTLAGRIGTPITPNALLYGKLGYANLQLREDQTVAGVTSSAKDNLDGVLVGAGVEVKLTPSAYWKSEYRYTDYASGVTSNKVTTGVGIRF
jgi:outer membrane immunogenic protein